MATLAEIVINHMGQILTCDWLASIRDVQVVGAWLVRDILDRAAAIFVINAGHLCLGGSLHCQAQTSCACPTMEITHT